MMFHYQKGSGAFGCAIVLGATVIVLFFLGFIARGC